MHVYIAADFARADEVAAIADELQTAGHTVVSRWHKHASASERAAAGQIGGPDRDAALAAATRNLADLDRANVVVVLTTGEPARGGRHFETGYAYRAGMPVILVGPIEHAFHRLDAVSGSTPAELIQSINRAADRPA